MTEELKHIRKGLKDAEEVKDWWMVNAMINRLDSLLYQLQSKAVPKKEVNCIGCSCKFPDNCTYQKERCEAPETYRCGYKMHKQNNYDNKRG